MKTFFSLIKGGYNMKAGILAGFLAAFLWVTMSVCAQATGFQSPSEIIAQMQSKLVLEPDQVTAITPIIEKYASKRQEFRQEMKAGTLDKAAMRGGWEKLRGDENAELSSILSQDQMNQWRNMQNHAQHRSAS